MEQLKKYNALSPYIFLLFACLSFVSSAAKAQSDKQPIFHCGVDIANQNAYLTHNIACTQQELLPSGAAFALYHASLDLNGYSIEFVGSSSFPSTGIFLDGNAQVTNKKSSDKKSEIRGFHTGIEVHNNHNSVSHLTITQGQSGVRIHGNKNKATNINIINMGGTVEVLEDLFVASGNGFYIEGSQNELQSNRLENIGYSKEGAQINSMFIYATGINVQGDDNRIIEQRMEHIFASGLARYNAQSSSTGILISGKNNIIKDSTLYKVFAAGRRTEVIQKRGNDGSGPVGAFGVQTGGRATGVSLTSDAAVVGHNTLQNSVVRNVFAIGEALENTIEPSIDITAEALGIQVIYNGQRVIKNTVEDVDAIAEGIPFAAGIRAVDENHLISQNISRHHGWRSEGGKTEGLSFDTRHSQIKNNFVEDNRGAGIQGSTLSASNTILNNKSIHNAGFDFIESQQEDDNTTMCRNHWKNNPLENSRYFPAFCFENR